MRYSSGPIVYTQIDAGTAATLMDDLKDALVSASWSLESTNKSEVNLSYTGQPANDQTCAFNGTTYTAKTSPTLPTHFGIGGDAKATYDNLAAAIESQDANLNAVNTGAGASGTLNVEWAPDATGYFTASESLNNATLDYTTSRNGGYMVKSVLTPHGLQMKLKIYQVPTDSGTHVRVRPYSFNESVSGTESPAGSNPCGEGGLTAATSRLLEVIAGPHYLWVFLAGSSATVGTVIETGTPYIRPAHRARQIVAVADVGGEFEVECAVPHGRVTGEHVFIDRALGVSGLNGDWQITVVDQYKYTLDGSTYAAGYTANSGFAAGPKEISRCIYFRSNSSPGGNTSWPTFRNSPFTRSSGAGVWVCLNQYTYSSNADAQWGPILQFPMIVDFNGTWTQADNWGPYADIIEPRLIWPVASQASTRFTVGELWDAFLLCDAVNKDVSKINFDNYNWINYMDNYTYLSLWLATGLTA